MLQSGQLISGTAMSFTTNSALEAFLALMRYIKLHFTYFLLTINVNVASERI